MTVHRIRLLGDPILRARCEPITKPRSTAVRVILDDMRETLRDWQSRFGSGRAIAAPQIGAPVRMIYCEMDQPWASPRAGPDFLAVKIIRTGAPICGAAIAQQHSEPGVASPGASPVLHPG